MSAVLILYSTVDGHTLTICRRIGRAVETAGHAVTLARIEDAGGVDLAAYDKVVIGASIRYGRHRRSVYEFIRQRLSLLESRPNAFFTVNIVARKPEKNRPETNPYLRRFLRRTPWKPQLVEVFAGRLDYPRCRPLDRLAIRFILWLSKGPTDPDKVFEFTNWERVDAFARQVAAMRESRRTEPS
ncbi:MAG: menaquinone-dependent protoporphyrinogen IX dehydrogenase [Candidatus Accumulibacter sp.]|jgi:menaquinone-dependent protoporphyrinogen oxidase|nr:menaquinone-dependent protoporphyrinogen IX dehydrogenase [Accumulibacter sp.]